MTVVFMQVTVDDDTGNQTTVISFGVGVKKRVSMNTQSVQQKNQVSLCRCFTYFLSKGLIKRLGSDWWARDAPGGLEFVGHEEWH